jgi:hypothetical protein
MSDHAITLTVPEHLYDQMRQAAETLSEPIESLVLRHIEEAFTESYAHIAADERAELGALRYLSVDALWTIVTRDNHRNENVR